MPRWEPDRRLVAPRRRSAGEGAVEDALRVRRTGRRGAVPQRGRPLPAGQAGQDHRQGRGDGVDSLAVRHRPAPAPTHRPPCPCRCSPPTARPRPEHRRPTRARRPAARLSYRRAEEIFEKNTRLPADPLASPDDVEELDGWTLHRLWHSTVTYDAENGTSAPMLLARSRHASVRALERYARPGVDSIARHVAERDPAARRRTQIRADQVSKIIPLLLWRISVTPLSLPRGRQRLLELGPHGGAGADLLAEDLVEGDAVPRERVEPAVEFLPEGRAARVADASVRARQVRVDPRRRRGVGAPRPAPAAPSSGGDPW